jgi:hypothetical protein
MSNDKLSSFLWEVFQDKCRICQEAYDCDECGGGCAEGFNDWLNSDYKKRKWHDYIIGEDKID